jgi:hypothetical protein
MLVTAKEFLQETTIIKEKEDSPEPEVIKLPLSCFENMQLEWSWRTDELDNLIKEVYEGYEKIRAEYKISKVSSPKK